MDHSPLSTISILQRWIRVQRSGWDFTGTDMDFNKGPNVITAFTNSKYGLIMVLHSVTESAIQEEVTSDMSSYPGRPLHML